MDAPTGAAFEQSGAPLACIEVLGVICLWKHGSLIRCTMGKILGPRMGQGSRLLRHSERITAGWVPLLRVGLSHRTAQTTGVCWVAPTLSGFKNGELLWCSNDEVDVVTGCLGRK